MKKDKKILVLVLSILVVAALIAGGLGLASHFGLFGKEVQTGNKANVDWYSEDEKRFTISTAEELYELAVLSDFYDFQGQTIKLDADIVVNEGDAKEWRNAPPAKRWQPIRGFAGTFDGQGHTISGLYGVGVDTSMGLFAETSGKCTIKNLKLVNSYFEVDGYFPGGSIAADGCGTFDKIYSNAIVVGNGENYGGIIGKANGIGGGIIGKASGTTLQTTKITNCWFDGEVHIEKNTGRFGGGIVGRVHGGTAYIEHCLNSGEITCNFIETTGSHIGGLVGTVSYNNYSGSLTMKDCLNVGKIDVNHWGCTGSVIGRTFSKTKLLIENVYTTKESADNYWGIIESSRTGMPSQIEEKYLLGNGGYEWTDLDFKQYWTIVKEDTPILQCFATEVPSVAGLKKAMDKSWYNEEKKEYVLDSVADLRGFQDLLKFENFKGKTVKLGADIVWNEGNAKDWATNPPANEWIPLGWTEVGKRTNLQKFAGTFDGQGHTISGLYTKSEGGGIGLFGNLEKATIKNLKITNSYFENTNTAEGGQWAMVGSVAGLGYGTIDTVYSDAIIVSNAQYTGGIIGYVPGYKTTVNNCWFDGSMELHGHNGYNSGGIVGGTNGDGNKTEDKGDTTLTVTNCLNSASITTDTENGNIAGKWRNPSVGGIVGYTYKQDMVIADCLNVGSVSSTGNTRCVGAINGWGNGAIVSTKNCYATVESSESVGETDKTGITQVAEKDILGVKGYVNTLLNFYDQSEKPKGYWAAVANETPVLKSFAGKTVSVAKLERAYTTSWYDESKTEFVIKTKSQLLGLVELSKETDFKGKTIKLGANIVVNEGKASDWAKTAPETQWIPIGWTEVGGRTHYQKFAGIFDGCGYTISGLYTKAEVGGIGLFGNITDATIKNVKITNSYFENTNTAEGGQWAMLGSVAGLGYGTIDTVYSDAIIVSNAQYTGGIIGYIPGYKSTVNNCWFAGSMELHGHNGYNSGGIVGGTNGDGNKTENKGDTTLTVTNCLNSGSITTDTENGNIAGKWRNPSVGGIVGYTYKQDMVITDCLNVGSVSSTGNTRCIGAINGWGNGAIVSTKNCYATIESSASVGETDKTGIKQLKEADIKGIKGYVNMLLDFYDKKENKDGVWAAIENATPVLKSFTDKALSTEGYMRAYDIGWYDESKTEYTINTAEELLGIVELSRSTDFKGKTIKLGKDIIFNTGNASDWATEAPKNSWMPIGWTEIDGRTTYKKFAGTFDGQGYSISGLYLKTDKAGVGLFGNIAGATIKDVKILNSYFESSWAGKNYWGLVGSIVGLGYGTFEKIHSDAIVIGAAQYNGGIIGLAIGGTCTFTDCWFSGKLEMKGAYGMYGGGIVGGNMSGASCNVSHCLVGGKETSALISELPSGSVQLGGFIGRNGVTSEITDSLAVATMNAKGSKNEVGTAIGWNGATLTATKTYAMTQEGYGLGGFTPTATLRIDSLSSAELTGTEGYKNTKLDFYKPTNHETGHWVAVDGKTPALKYYTDEFMSLDGIMRGFDTDWYDATKTTFTLYTAEEFLGFAELAKTNNFAGKTIRLGANIVFNANEGNASTWGTKAPAFEWMPIGWANETTSGKQFAGTFDGMGFSISGLYVSSDKDGLPVGLFGDVRGATIRNVKILNSYFENTWSAKGSWSVVGSIAGMGYGTFHSVYSEAHLVGSSEYVGGMVGLAIAGKASFTNCWFQGNLTLEGDNGRIGGGILGGVCSWANNGYEIISCLNAGTLHCETTTQGPVLGGLVGASCGAAVIRDSLSIGMITVDATTAENKGYAGSIVAYKQNGSIEISKTYGMRESYKYGDNNGYTGKPFTTDGTYLKSRVELTGSLPKDNNLLAFYNADTDSGYWEVNANGTPTLRLSLGLTDVIVEPDTSWYNTTDTTFTLDSLAEFLGFVELAKTNNFAGKTLTLTTNITFNKGNASSWSGSVAPANHWISIGMKSATVQGTQFAGTFDGGGYTISGLYSYYTQEGPMGLFGKLAGGTIKNVRVVNSYFESTVSGGWVGMGSIVGLGYGTIENAYSDAYLTSAAQRTGGIWGWANGGKVTIKNAAYTGTLTMKGTAAQYGGGILGYVASGASFELENCLSSGILKSECSIALLHLGGLVAVNQGSASSIKNSLCTATITDYEGNDKTYVGSIIAWVPGGTVTLTNTYAMRESYTQGTYNGYTGATFKDNADYLRTREELTGEAAKTNTALPFYNSTTDTGYWVVEDGKTPVLRIAQLNSTLSLTRNQLSTTNNNMLNLLRSVQ